MSQEENSEIKRYCETCINEARIRFLESVQEKNSEQHKNFFERFEQVSNQNVRMEERFNNIMSTLNQMNLALGELKGKDGKNWQMVVGALIVAVITVGVSYFMAK